MNAYITLRNYNVNSIIRANSATLFTEKIKDKTYFFINQEMNYFYFVEKIQNWRVQNADVCLVLYQNILSFETER